MKAISGKDLARLVEASGWVLQRVHGSHHVYARTGSVVRLSIPVHGNKPLKIGLQRHLMKLAGIAETDL
jgi:predicted RNA binding protein YcfA (HicA-like mRNA interferase family)